MSRTAVSSAACPPRTCLDENTSSSTTRCADSLSAVVSYIDDVSKTARPSKHIVKTVQREVWLLDTETTGLSPKTDRIVEIALLRYHPCTDGGALSWLINPKRSVPKSASKVHGLTDDILSKADSFPKVWNQVLSVVSKSCPDQDSGREPPLMVAHNARFDRGFVESELQRAGFQVPNWCWACSMQGITRVLWPGRSARLSSILRFLGESDFDAHRAASDVEALAILLRHGEETLYKQKYAKTMKNVGECNTDFFKLKALICLLEENANNLKNQVSTRQFGTQGPSSLTPRCSSDISASASTVQTTSPLKSSSDSLQSDTIFSNTFYITRKGQVWHASATCPRLKQSTSVEVVAKPANRRPCSVCALCKQYSCAVCLETIAIGSPIKLDPCQHRFHRDCLTEWSTGTFTCPVCRARAVGDEELSGVMRLAADQKDDSRSGQCLRGLTLDTGELGGVPADVGLEARVVETFFGTASGICYHSDNLCYGLRSASKVISISSNRRRACKICISGGTPAVLTSMQS